MRVRPRRAQRSSRRCSGPCPLRGTPEAVDLRATAIGPTPSVLSGPNRVASARTLARPRRGSAPCSRHGVCSERCPLAWCVRRRWGRARPLRAELSVRSTKQPNVREDDDGRPSTPLRICIPRASEQICRVICLARRRGTRPTENHWAAALTLNFSKSLFFEQLLL